MLKWREKESDLDLEDVHNPLRQHFFLLAQPYLRRQALPLSLSLIQVLTAILTSLR